jgi:hypothetical protein
MAGPPFAFAQHFQVVGHFRGVDPTETWRTELTVTQPANVPQPTDPIILAIRDYFRHNLRNDCFLDHIELRQWSFGPQPLAGRGALWELAVAQSGLKVSTYGAEGSAVQVLGKEVVAFVKQDTISAKPGKQFIRQLYDGQDIYAVAGSPWAYGANPNVTATVYGTSTTATLGAYFGNAASPQICVVHFSKKNYDANPVTANLPFSTAVTGMRLIGPTTNRPTRKNKR